MLKNGLICLIPFKRNKININRMTSFVKDSHGVSLIASPKHPQSFTTSK